MIGDRMDTDIVGGLEAGMRTCLVLSGVSTRDTVERFPYRPTSSSTASLTSIRPSWHRSCDRMEIRIPSLLRIKPNALYKLGKYLRKNGFHRIALYYGEGIADLVGQKVEISLDSSEIQVVTRETVHGNDVTEIVSSAFRLPARPRPSSPSAAGSPSTSASTPGS